MKGEGRSQGNWVRVTYKNHGDKKENKTKKVVVLEYDMNGVAGRTAKRREIRIEELSARKIIRFVRQNLGELRK